MYGDLIIKSIMWLQYYQIHRTIQLSTSPFTRPWWAWATWITWSQRLWPPNRRLEDWSWVMTYSFSNNHGRAPFSTSMIMGGRVRDLPKNDSSWLTPGSHCLDVRNLVAGESVLIVAALWLAHIFDPPPEIPSIEESIVSTSWLREEGIASRQKQIEGFFSEIPSLKLT